MKKASQLDWNDLQEIAKMKGVGVLAPSVPAPDTSAPSSSDSEPEPASDVPMCEVAEGGQSANPAEQAVPAGFGLSGSQERDAEMS